MTQEIDRAREPAMPYPPNRPPLAPAVSPQDPVLIVGGADAADLTGVAEAMAPLVDLALSPLAQTPFRVGLVGPFGSGKSFALQRLTAAMSVAASQPPEAAAPRHSKIIIAKFDAAGLGADHTVGFDPASALAAAVYVALENGRDGVSYAALADDVAHGAADPGRAALAAAERHEDVSRRLEAERATRGELESRRARLTEAVLYETPGSRIDSMIRSSRATIEARLRRFGFGDGDATVNFRNLLRDLAAASAARRAGLALRATWAYRGQSALLLIVVLALLVAFGLDRLHFAADNGALADLGEGYGFATVAKLISDNAIWVGRAIAALIVIAGLALFYDLWRALGFSALLYRGLRILRIDMAERRRDLDASIERANRKLANLTAESEVAAKRAEAMARRAGGARSISRAPGPAFLKALETPAKTSRDFFAELSRQITRPSSPETLAPSRLILAIDNLEALAPVDAARLIDATQALIGPGLIALIACDPAQLAPTAPAAFARTRFDVIFNVAAVAGDDSAKLAARLAGDGASAPPAAAAKGRPVLAEPLTAAESALLAALAPLTEGTPGAIRRLYNAYRLARLSDAPRPLVALMLAALQSPNRDNARVLAAAVAPSSEDTLEEPSDMPALVAAVRAARGAHGGPLSKADAAAAWNAARRWTPPQG